MASKWKNATVEQACALIADCPHSTPKWTDDGVIVLRNTYLKDGRLDLSDVRFTDEENYLNRTRRATPQGGDIVISREAPMGEVAMIPEGLKTCLGQRLVLLRPNPEICDSKFMLYSFVGGNLRRQVMLHDGTGSTVSNLRIPALKTLEIALPPIEEQRAIAHILGTLDDKIELNRRMNETLEAMARALFKSWFVDFDPIRAKAAGRDPGLPKHIADLFPDRFEDSELGEIPEGWKVNDVDSLCESITSGGTPARMNPAYWRNGTIPWFKTGELLDGPLLDSEEHITEAALANSSCKMWPAGAILFALYASPTVGRLGALTRPGASNQAAAGLVAKVAYGVPFLKQVLLHAREKLQAIAVGAAQQNINQRVLKSHRVLVPHTSVANTFSQLVAPFDQQQATTAEQSRTLAALRDTLLPKLISGEIRVNPENGSPRAEIAQKALES